jgi:hypothetical protein
VSVGLGPPPSTGGATFPLGVSSAGRLLRLKPACLGVVTRVQAPPDAHNFICVPLPHTASATLGSVEPGRLGCRVLLRRVLRRDTVDTVIVFVALLIVLRVVMKN